MEATQPPGSPGGGPVGDAATVASEPGPGQLSWVLRAAAAADAGAPGRSERQAAAAVRAALFGEIAPPLLPRYRLVRVLGRGAMGEVWQAHDPRLDRDVAVKLILPRLEGGMVASIRIAREARALARLTHPNVVGVYDVGSYDGSQGRGTFIVMELVHGVSLDVWLAQRRRSVDEILALFCQAGDGLAAAHAAGIVHRDFKPSNVLVGADGRARVGDFGLARAVGAAEARGASQGAPRAGIEELGETQADRLTETGAVLGTPLYMAPEQHDGSEADERADQYAFCTSLFEAIVGRRPFRGGIEALAAAKATTPLLTPAEQRATPTRIQQAILRGLAPRPEDRHESMPALLAVLRGGPVRRSRRFVAGAAIALGISGLAFAGADAPKRCPELPELASAPTQARLERALVEGLDAPQVAAVARRVRTMHDAIAGEHATTCAIDPELASGRAACVRAAARHYAAALDVLTQYDVTAQQAQGVLDAAPNVRACVDADDEHGGERSRGEAQERRLMQARALGSVGRYDEALTLALEVRGSLESPEARLGREATWIRSTLEVGRELAAVQRQRDAIAQYEAGYLAALERGFDALAYDAARSMAMEHAALGEYALAERWAAHAEAAQRALPPAQARPWDLDFMRAVIANYHVDHATVTTLLRKVIANCQSHDCGETIVSARRDLARTYWLMDDYPAAQSAWREEHVRSAAAYGRDAPYTIEAEIFETAAAAANGDEQGPARLAALATRLDAMDPPPAARLRAMAKLELAAIHARASEPAEALSLATAAAELAATQPGLAELRAVALGRAAEYAEALGDDARVGALLDAAIEADAPPITQAQTYAHRTAYLARRGRLDEALANAETSRDLMREHFSTAAAWVATAESNVLLTLLMLERCPEALAQSEVTREAWTHAYDDPTAAAMMRDLHAIRGICLERAGQRLAAASEYRAALLLGGPGWSERGELERSVATLEHGEDPTPARATIRPVASAATDADDATPR